MLHMFFIKIYSLYMSPSDMSNNPTTDVDDKNIEVRSRTIWLNFSRFGIKKKNRINVTTENNKYQLHLISNTVPGKIVLWSTSSKWSYLQMYLEFPAWNITFVFVKDIKQWKMCDLYSFSNYYSKNGLYHVCI